MPAPLAQTASSFPDLPHRPSTAGSRLWTSESAERLLKPLSRAPELDHVESAEFEAKKLRAQSHRDLINMARLSSTTNLHAQRKARAVAVRSERYAETGKDLMFKLKVCKPANEREVTQLSMALNAAMCHIYPQSRSQASYFNLFRFMDKDGSGLISYYEFLRMIRDQLKLPESRFPEAQVEAMWRWVDEDASGMIGAGEFLRLMRKGWDGFLEEQKAMAKKSLLWRPNWNPAIYVTRIEESVWAEQTTTLQEKRRFYLDVAQTEAYDRAKRMAHQAQSFERKRQEAEERFKRTTKGLNNMVDPTMMGKPLGGLSSSKSLGSLGSLGGRPMTASTNASRRS